MLQKKSEFRIKRFRNSKEQDFLNSLIIYSENIAPEIKTNTNEIAYWIDNFNTFFEKKELFVFGLYYDEKLIGYAQLVYFETDKFIFIDYFCLNDPYKKNAIFYPLYNLIESYFLEARYDYKYIITEVSYTDGSLEIDEASILLLNLLFMENYGIVDATYYQPLLGLDNEESNFENKLMIKSNEPIKSLKKETYIKLIQVIYKDHYLTWYKPILKEDKLISNYAKHIDEIFESVKSKNSQEIFVFDTYSKIYGNKSIIASKKESFSTAGPIKELKTKKSDIKTSLAFLLIVLIINIGLFISFNILKIDLQYFWLSFILLLSSLFVFLSLFSKRAEVIMTKIPELFNFFLKK